MKVSHDLPLHKVIVHIMCSKICLGGKADHKNWMWADIGVHTRYRFASSKERRQIRRHKRQGRQKRDQVTSEGQETVLGIRNKPREGAGSLRE